METPSMPMHISGTQIFRAGPLAREDGGIDVASIRRLTESVLHRIPRYRQKLAWVPGENHAVWVDDAHFSVDYHLRHTSLPRPGTEAQLKRLAALIMEQPLDRARPLWETWVVEGLEHDRFAMIAKIHYCMIDGSSGVDLSQILQSPSPAREIHEAPRFMPRPLPSSQELRRDSRMRLLALPLRWAGGLYDFARKSEDLVGDVATRVGAVREILSWQLHRPSETPLNGMVGPHRIFDWLELPLEDFKKVSHTLGCTVNDVILTTVTGTIREFLIRRQVRPEELDFRVAAPVDVRKPEEQGRMGNRVAAWSIPLPLHEADPLRQLETLMETTLELKSSHAELGLDVMISVLEDLPFDPPVSLASRSVNTLVTNVRGPGFPLYLLGAEMLECYPQAPLLEGMGIAIGVLSYNGRVCFGLNADYDRIPDLADFTRLLRRSFQTFAAAAAAGVEVESGEAAGAARRKASPATSEKGNGDGARGRRRSPVKAPPHRSTREPQSMPTTRH
jgi:WS/DGAT/MGAT family acyltransferase